MIMGEYVDKNEQVQPKKSRLGIASFVISIVSAAIFSLTVLCSTFLQSVLPEDDIHIISIAIILVDFGISITGLAIGLTGLLLERAKKLPATVGMIVNLWTTTMLFLFFFSLAEKERLIFTGIFR